MVESNKDLQMKCTKCGSTSAATSMRMSLDKKGQMICSTCYEREKSRDAALKNVSRI